ncbi:MAG: hypothetical protein WC378_10345 [Opitutaceae bacterium]|jgi:Spy/CpxP family protein refolding chaperone
MKSFTKSLITLATLALAFSAPALRAKDGGAEPAKQHPQHMGERISPAERADKMAKHLGLTDDQKQRILAILQEEATAGKALWDDKSLSKEDRRAKIKALRESDREKIAAVLTPEQKAKLEKEHHGKHGPEPK